MILPDKEGAVGALTRSADRPGTRAENALLDPGSSPALRSRPECVGLYVGPMHVGMVFRCFGSMVRRMHCVAVRDMCMMSRFLVIALPVMLRRLAMMFCRVFVMFGGRFVMLDLGVARH